MVFIGPCVAKRKEAQRDEAVDFIMTFEEVASVLAGLDIQMEQAQPYSLSFTSVREAHGFAQAGGVMGAVKAYLKEEEHRGRTAKENQIITILQACTNRRDQLLLLMLAETGYRIGELLGVKYVKDIDYRNHMIRVCFREDNENEARAKNAEYRSAKISNDTFEFLMDYLAKYRKILQHQDYLFVNIMGENIGKPLRVDSVYDMLDRMEKKTGVKITPHMLRHYFANMRKQAGWELEMISQALGHKHLDTTIKYLDWLDDELIEASNEFYAQHTAIYGAERLLE